jgi:hypothetical protein
MHRRRRLGVVILGAAALAVLLGGAGRARADIAMPVTLSGWNADVVTDANPATRFAQQFDYGATPGIAVWYENGIVVNGKTLHNGLPSGQNFTSQIINSVTGTPTVFHLQPADGNNVLRMSTNLGVPSATLTLTTPGQFSSLAVLASSGAAFGMGSGTLTLNFSDGTHSQPVSYDASDWNISFGNPAHVALGPLGRNNAVNANISLPSGSNLLLDPGDTQSYVLYETDINLAALGLNGKPLASITFTPATNAPDPAAITGVFAVSGVEVGVAVPEPGSLALLGVGVAVLAGYGWRRRPGA